MQCDKCKVEMERGILVLNGTGWTKMSKPTSWWSKPIIKLVDKYVIAWRCPNCDSLVFKTEEML